VVSGPRRGWAILGVVALGTFMTALDASIVNIGLPSIARTFRTPVGGAAEWVVIAYLVAIAATLLSFGHLSDLVGRKPVWLAGLATFTVGSMLCGAAPSLASLVLARAFQGLGGAMIFAPGLAIITDAFPPAGRGRALGVNAVVFAVGTSLGPTFGGLITGHLSWRWIFYLNVPLGALALLASQATLPRSGPHRREPFDVAGAGLLAVGFALLTVVLSFSPEWGWGSVRLLTCLAVGTIALVGTALVERRAPRPIIDFSLFRERMLASSLGSMTLAMLALFAISFMLPFYFEELRGFSVEKSGLLLTPLPLTIAVVAPVSGSLADRIGSRWLAAGGLALACLGLLFLARLDAASTLVEVIGCLVLTGAGQGMFQTPNARALMNAVPPGKQGEAAGLLATGRVVGQSLSVALAGAIFADLGGASAGRALAATRAGAVAPDNIAALQQTFLTGFKGALMVCAAVAAAGLLATLIRGDEQQPASSHVPVPETAGPMDLCENPGPRSCPPPRRSSE
jgi:EmrB/QacA subfamily drug resistance transporter